MDEGILERFRLADSCLVSDALDRFGRSGVALEIRRIATSARISGPVATIELGQSPAHRRPSSHLGASTLDVITPGSVIVVANGARTAAAAWGGLLSRAAWRRGVAGVVIDGAARDVDEIGTLGLPLFARCATPVSARGRYMEIASGTTVAIAGIRVSPGDWVIADGSGVVFIEQKDLERISRAVVELMEEESRIATEIDEGVAVSAAMGVRYETRLEEP